MLLIRDVLHSISPHLPSCSLQTTLCPFPSLDLFLLAVHTCAFVFTYSFVRSFVCFPNDCLDCVRRLFFPRLGRKPHLSFKIFLIPLDTVCIGAYLTHPTSTYTSTLQNDQISFAIHSHNAHITIHPTHVLYNIYLCAAYTIHPFPFPFYLDHRLCDFHESKSLKSLHTVIFGADIFVGVRSVADTFTFAEKLHNTETWSRILSTWWH